MDAQWKKQAACGQLSCMFAQIGLIEFQRGAAVQLIEHIGARPRNDAMRPEGVPSAHAGAADVKAIAVEADRRDLSIARPGVGANKSLFERAPIPGKAAGDKGLRR